MHFLPASSFLPVCACVCAAPEGLQDPFASSSSPLPAARCPRLHPRHLHTHPTSRWGGGPPPGPPARFKRLQSRAERVLQPARHARACRGRAGRVGSCPGTSPSLLSSCTRNCMHRPAPAGAAATTPPPLPLPLPYVPPGTTATAPTTTSDAARSRGGTRTAAAAAAAASGRPVRSGHLLPWACCRGLAPERASSRPKPLTTAAAVPLALPQKGRPRKGRFEAAARLLLALTPHTPRPNAPSTPAARTAQRQAAASRQPPHRTNPPGPRHEQAASCSGRPPTPSLPSCWWLGTGAGDGRALQGLATTPAPPPMPSIHVCSGMRSMGSHPSRRLSMLA